MPRRTKPLPLGKPVTLSIKNVPVELVQRLHDRASRNGRSLQEELLAILEAAAQRLTPKDLVALTRRLKLKTPADSARIIRALRD